MPTKAVIKNVPNRQGFVVFARERQVLRQVPLHIAIVGRIQLQFFPESLSGRIEVPQLLVGDRQRIRDVG